MGAARGASLGAPAKPLDPVAKEGLLLPYGSWADRIATLRFVQDIPMQPTHPSYDELTRVEAGLGQLKAQPMLLMW